MNDPPHSFYIKEPVYRINSKNSTKKPSTYISDGTLSLKLQQSPHLKSYGYHRQRMECHSETSSPPQTFRRSQEPWTTLDRTQLPGQKTLCDVHNDDEDDGDRNTGRVVDVDIFPKISTNQGNNPTRDDEDDRDDEGSDVDGMKILEDLDDVLEQDEQMSLEQVKQNVHMIDVTLRQYEEQSVEFVEPPIDYDDQENFSYGGKLSPEGCRDRSQPNQSPYMDGGKGDKETPDGAVGMLNESIINELRQMTDGINSLARYKKERNEEIINREKEVNSKIEAMKQEYTAERFVEKTPTHFRGTDIEIPQWKRLLMAQKLATEAIKTEEQELWDEYDRWKQQFLPNYRRTK